MNEPLWIREFKSSVSWGDQIKTCLEHEVDFPVLTMKMDLEYYYIDYPTEPGHVF